MSSMAGAMIDVGAVQRGRALARQLLVALWLTGLCLFVLLAGLLLLRRLSGALVRPLGGWSLVGMAFVAVAMAAGLRWPGWTSARRTAPWFLLGTEYSVRSTQYPFLKLLPTATFFLPGFAALLLLAALPSASISEAMLAWLLLIGAETGSWLLYHRPPRGAQGASVDLAAEEAESSLEAEIPDGLVQQITRTREGACESLHALLLANIPAGDRLAILHIAFCPPLETAPELTAHAIEAEDVEIRITQAETFGTRIEVRAERAREARRVVVEMIGSAGSARKY